MFHDRRSNKEILAELDKRVYGHTEAKKALINLINRSKIRHYQKWIQLLPKEHWIDIGKCLLLGQSGTGKTHMIESLAQIVRFPLLRITATNLNPTGASGGIKEEDLKRLIKATAKEFSQEEVGYYHCEEGVIDQMVVFVDEIDKLGLKFDSGGNWNQHVQANFLTMFDNKVEYSGVSFIFAGAFNEITQEKVKKETCGFIEKKVIEKADYLEELIVKSGLIPELVGRLTSIVELDKFTVEDYYKILTTVVLPKKQYDLYSFNVADSFLTEEQLRDIATRASKSGQGVRSLTREINKQFAEREFDYEDGYYDRLLEQWDYPESENKDDNEHTD